MPTSNLIIPSTDEPPGFAPDGRMYPCAHCLLLAKGVHHSHSVLAVAQADRIPQYAWFNTYWLPILSGAVSREWDTEYGYLQSGFSSWEVTSKWAKLKVTRPALNQNTFIWRFTDRVHMKSWLLGVWAD